MRRESNPGITAVFLFFLIFFGGSVFVSAQAADGVFEPAEVVIRLSRTADLPVVAAQYGLNPTPICQLGNSPLYRMQILGARNVSEVVSQLRNDARGRVVYAEPNYLIGAPGQSNLPWSMGGSWSIGSSVKGYSNQWMAQKINLSASHLISRGQGIRVAVLDTGIDYHHTVFANRLLPGYDYVDYDYYAAEVGAWGQGAYGHGTAVAAIVTIVAPEAKIIPVRVLDQNGMGNVWRLAEGLKFAANPDGNIYTDDGAHVINLSLGTTEKTFLIRDLLGALGEGYRASSLDDLGEFGNRKIVVVAAAGNTGDGTRIFPAAEQTESLIAVAASTNLDTLATFSTRGNWVSVMAPGEGIVSAIPNGRFATWRGTSMAAPVVSGIAALVMVKHPNMSSDRVAAHIRGTSTDVADSIFLRVDAGRALTINPVQ